MGTHTVEGCVTAEEIQSGARGGCSSGARREGQECVIPATPVAIPACGCCSMCGEEGCGHSRITPLGTPGRHSQHSAAVGEQRSVLALPVAGHGRCHRARLAPLHANSQLGCVQCKHGAGNTNSRLAQAGCAGARWPWARFSPSSSLAGSKCHHCQSHFQRAWVGTGWTWGKWCGATSPCSILLP